MPLTLKRLPLVMLFTAAVAAIVLVAVINARAGGIGSGGAAAGTAAVPGMPSDARSLDELALTQLQLAREDGDPAHYRVAEHLLRRARRSDPGDFTALGGL